jgi:predicted nucleotidyltransferase component of viral defense system
MKLGNPISIRTALKNISDRENIDFQTIATRYLHERLLFRVASSNFAQNFFLKGGALFYAFEGLHARPTLDIDFLAKQIDNDKENLKTIFTKICEIEYADDCVLFNKNTIEVFDIDEDAKYSGVRVLLNASFDSIKQRLQIDIGFSDIITPEPVHLTYPTLLNELKNPEIRAYSIETVIAEKFHAMFTLGTLNSRMKDFYDVYILLKNNKIENANLQDSISQTFKNRNTDFTDDHEIFSTLFYENKNRQAMWKAFLRKMKIFENLEFPSVVKTILERLQPIYNELLKSKI